MKGPVLLSSFLLYPMSSGHGISLIVNIIDPRPSLTEATFKVNSIHQARNDPVDSSVKHLWRMVFFRQWRDVIYYDGCLTVLAVFTFV